VDTWTVDALADLPGELRYEIHNGSLLIQPQARVWREEIAARTRSYLRGRGLFAVTNVGVVRVKDDVRVSDVAVFRAEPDPDDSWHHAAKLSLVVEMWSPSSRRNHRDMQWFADLGIPEYWLAKPVDGEPWGAAITRYRIARTAAGETTYVEDATVALATLEYES
jgi:Uma2 family endonuclease